MVSMVSSTPWPASATTGENAASHDTRRKVIRLLVSALLFILDGHVFVVRCPRHSPFDSWCVPQDPKSSARIRRACKYKSVFMDKDIVSVTVVRVGSCKRRWNKVADALGSIGIGDVDRPEARIFPGAENNISLYHPLHIVNAKPPSRPVRRTKSVQRQPKSPNLNGIVLIADVQDMHVTERALLGSEYLVSRYNEVGPARVWWNNNSDAVSVSFLRRGPLDLADLGRFTDIADIENNNTFIAVCEICAVFVRRDVMEKDPDLGQPFPQPSFRVYPVLSSFFPSGSPLPRKPPTGNLPGFGRIGDVGNDQDVAVVTFLCGRNEGEFSPLRVFMEPESVDAAAGRTIGLEECRLPWLCRIADIEETNAPPPRS